MKIEHINEIKGIVILALSLLLLASLASFTPYDLNWYTSLVLLGRTWPVFYFLF
jgi:hypothetical protein